MAVVLLKLVFSILSTLSGLITRLILATAAHVVVQVIQALQVQGESSHRILDQIKSVMQAFLEYMVNLIIGVIGSVLSSLFDVLKEGLLSSASDLVGAVAGLMEKSKASLDDAVKDSSEVLEAFTQMVGKIVTDLLNNCNDALAHVKENAF